MHTSGSGASFYFGVRERVSSYNILLLGSVLEKQSDVGLADTARPAWTRHACVPSIVFV